MLAMYLASEPEHPKTKQMTENGLELGAVIYNLLKEVESNVGSSHGQLSRFGQTVRRKFEEVKVDITRADSGLLARIEAERESQWKLLRSDQ